MDLKQQPQNYTPEEAALLVRLRIFVNMRWMALLGVLAATLFASKVFHIDFPTLPVYLICIFVGLYNLVFFVQARNLKNELSGRVVRKAHSYSNIHIVLDLITLTFLIHFTGGIENPFVFYFVFHAIVASILLNRRTTYLLASIALAMIVFLVGLEFAGWIPHHNLGGFADPTLYRDGGYILPMLVALATVLYGSVYMTTAISGELRRRQRQAVQLGAELLEKKTEEIVREKEHQEVLSKAYQDLSQSLQQLQESQEQLIQAEKLSSLGQLAASIAHEVNSPMSGVLVYTQLLEKKLASNDLPREVALEYLSKIETELKRSTQMIKNLLNFARQSKPTLREVNINDIMNRAFDLAAHAARMQQVQVFKELMTDLPDITADFDQLQQVFTNLILNAIQAMSQGGKLTLRTSVDKDHIKVDVSDTGHGISPENIHKLFTPFFTTKQEGKGVGLGLAISYGIIQRHNGRIEVQSQEKVGTTFTVYLPLKAAVST